MMKTFETLFSRHQILSPCAEDIRKAFRLLNEALENNGTVLVCGNGGSSSDADHIVGELMKRFRLPRPLPEHRLRSLTADLDEQDAAVIRRMEVPLRAIALGRQPALATAFSNDVAPELLFAQEVLGYGQAGDTLLGLSTSGNSRNVVLATQVARAIGLKTIALTGRSGGRLAKVSDVSIRVPADDTAEVQELHLPVYHALCAALEEYHFG